MRFLLEVGSWLLPRSRRARWREESLSLLLDVNGWRRWWYTVDLLVKVPMLAWHLHPRPAARWPSPAAVLAGMGLVLAAFAVPGAYVLSPFLGEQNTEALLLLAPFGLAVAITRHAVRRARRPVLAVPVVVFGAFGPLVGVGILAAGAAAPGWIQSATAIAGYAALAGPGVWLAANSWRAIRHRQRQRPMHAFGLIAGSAFVLTIAGLLWPVLIGGSPPLPVLVAMAMGLYAFLAAFPVWAAWTGVSQIIHSARRPRERTAGQAF
ncbi:hypothetical protein [Micromonospora sp. CPCC 206061]|uniref:hypothetical protein n=1 Tax=Micromonospora sp. CPCC 206061 TaxID=3122410 RepID=UPI002FF05889